MAKKSMIEKNNRRRQMSKSFANRRKKLKAIVQNKKLPVEERFAATGLATSRHIHRDCDRRP